MIPITNTPAKDRLYMQCARSELDQTTQFDACAKWVEESAQLWMHRPRAGWPPELRAAYDAIHDVSDANGSVYARLKWWKDRADDDADEIQRLREGIDCATNALTDSILCSGNDAATNMQLVRKLKALLSGPNGASQQHAP